MKKYSVVVFFLISIFYVSAMDLSILEKDTLVIQNPDGGYDLYIRKIVGVNSVLITESTKDFKNQESNYAYRDPDFNTVNGNENRLLNGKFLSKDSKIYSLIDSTPEKETPIGTAFHVWIPYVIEFGYDWTRHGEVQVLDGTYLNIRSFEKPYADYTGQFKDNPFVLRVTQEPVGDMSVHNGEKYMVSAVKSFDSLAKETQGMLYYASGPNDITSLMKEPLKRGGQSNLQVVFVIDATASMRDDIAQVRKSIKPIMEKTSLEYKRLEVGIVLYKDYNDDFLTRRLCNFTSNLSKFYGALGHFNVNGGKDIPEGVYEGINEAMGFNWTEDSDTKKVIILIGDAPPHKIPRGKITKEVINKKAAQQKVSIYPIILPHSKTK